MVPNRDRGKKTQFYFPTIQDFAVKPKSQNQTQTQTHPHYEIKVQNQYESLIELSPLVYNQVMASTTPHIPQKP